VRLVLIAGFLGSGKTTFCINLARAAVARGKSVAILVNEIGEIGIDDQLMRQLHLNVWELFGGCICCTLSADLVSTLQDLDAKHPVDIVMLEPSGAAEPANILKALPYYKGRPLSIKSLTMLDPLRLEALFQVLNPLITRQIDGANILLINKEDAATADEIAAARRIAAEVNPRARVWTLSARAELDSTLVAELLL
jgi:G3E family GTPase